MWFCTEGEVVDSEFLLSCKEKLISTKSRLLNELVELKQNMVLLSEEKGGDEADQSLRILDEKNNLSHRQRILTLLVDIEHALKKIEDGTFGFCEETSDPIENERLSLLPWTRLSIEGAELRESNSVRFRKRNQSFP